MKYLRIFGLGADQEFAYKVAGEVQRILPPFRGLSPHKEERRPDGEAYTTSLDNVRGCDVFIVASLHGDMIECVDQKMMKLLIFINTLRHASAGRITVVARYLPYMRQDRKTESRAPIATQAVAMMLETVGMDRLLTMDVHNLAAEQNAFRIPIDNLEARKPLADAVVKEIVTMGLHREPGQFKVLTPDAGGASRTKLFQESLSRRLSHSIGIVYADKTRTSPRHVEVKIIGDVKGYRIIVIDDIISTGGTIGEIDNAVREADGIMHAVCATHGLFVDGAAEKLRNVPRIFVSDSVEPFRLEGTSTFDAVRVVPTYRMFAEAICRTHSEGGSLSELLVD